MSMSNVTEKICGIYKITNLLSGKAYIGQSVDIRKRFIHHTSNDNKQRMKMAISKAIHKYGKDNFKFEIIKECTRLELNKYESFFVERHNTLSPNGYNLRQGGDARIGMYSDEARENMSNARKGMKLSDSARANIARASTGRLHTEETKLKMSKARTGEKMTDEARKKMSESAKRKPPPSLKTRQKLSLANKGKTRTDNAKPVMRSDGVVFLSASEASRALGLKHARSVSNAIGAGCKAGGFNFNYIEGGQCFEHVK